MIRRTLKGVAKVAGAGLFTARQSVVVLSPRESGGVVFRVGGVEIPACVEHVVSPPGLPGRCTSVGANGATVITTEHVLSALVGCGVSDVTVEVRGEARGGGLSVEVPILDGSAAGFVEAILGAGAREIAGALEPIRIARPVTVSSADGSATITATPRASPGASYVYELEYPSLRQMARIELGEGASGDAERYLGEVGVARTFCFEREAEAMRRAGLFQHVSPREMLVLREDGTPIDNALRMADEPARHKVLDLMGDLALAGPLQVDVVARRAGHALNQRMAAALVEAGAAAREMD